MDSIERQVQLVIEQTGFAGVVSIEQGHEPIVSFAAGMADRRANLPNELWTRLAIASGTKGFTALAALRLADADRIDLDAPVRLVLDADLPLIDDRVTLDHLLSHRSGIGDYLDESTLGAIDDYIMPVPVHELSSTESYLAVLGGHPQVAEPGLVRAYNNGGYVVAALVLERMTGRPFEDLVVDQVCVPAGLSATGFVRSDELPADMAIGYLGDSPRTNALHLPLLGSGDGGVASTLADISRLWRALFAGELLSDAGVAKMFEPGWSRGVGVNDDSSLIWLEGYDAGISFKSFHDRAGARTATVMSNTSDGAWPVARILSTWMQAPNQDT